MADYPKFKTHIEIARERKDRYEKDMNLDQPLTHNDLKFFFKEKAFPPKPKFPWPEVLILAAVAVWIWYNILFK